MRKLFLTLSLLVASMATWAWENPATNNSEVYPDRFILPLQVLVNGIAEDAPAAPVLEVAAFIDGKLRAVEKTTTDYALPGSLLLSVYELKIYGTADDFNQKVTIKVRYENLVYVFTETIPYQYGVRDGGVKTLTLTPLAGVSLTNPIEIEAVLPTARDLTAYVSYEYAYDYLDGNNATAEPVTVHQVVPDEEKGIVLEAEVDEIESNLTWKWDAVNSTDNSKAPFTVTGNTLTATEATGEEGSALGLEVSCSVNLPNPDTQELEPIEVFTANARTMVIVKSLVSELALNPNVLTLCVGDNLRQILDAETPPVTVLVTPANASDRTCSWAVKAGEEDFAPNLIIEKIGVFHVVYTANDGSGVSTELTIKVVGDFTYPTEVTAAIGTPQAFAITLPDALKEENFGFDPTKISFMVNGGLRDDGDHPFTTELADETGLNWNITGKYVGEYEFVVAYDGKPIPTKDDTGAPVASVVKIPARVALADGWNWSSAFAVVGESYALLTNEGVQEQIKDADGAKKINEIRSQTKYIFNDPVYGFFGDLSELKPDSMYKIKSNGARILDFGSSARMARNHTWNLNTGYNWVNYPYEFDVTVADLQDMLPLPAEAEGDFILAKGAQMRCDYNSETAQGQWITDDNFEKFEAGKGYIYYRAGEPMSCTFNANLKAPKPNAPNGIRGKNTVRVWEVQSSRFADNMPIVATVEGLRNPENYIVGAFVGDECRGTGSLAVRDLMFISVAGVAGEKITFRLYNKFTGEFSTINEEVTYSGKAGSMKAPLRLSSPAATGVSSLKANEAASDAVYNLAGQKLSAPRKGIHIVGGRKVVF